MQTDDPLVSFADAEQQDARRAEPLVRLITALHFELVARHQRNAAPSDDRRAEQVHRHRRNAAPGALALERGNRLRVSQEEGRLLPDQREQFIQVIGRRCAVTGADPHRRIDRVNEAELLAVDQFPLLAFFDPLDRQPHLFLQLIERIVVQVRHASVDADDRLHGRQRVLARMGRVIDERLRDLDVLGKARDEIDVPFAVTIDGRT